MHLKSIWTDPRIETVELTWLTPSSVHGDNRHKTKILPTLLTQGLFYPLLCIKFTPGQWQQRVVQGTNKTSASRLPKPRINADGLVWVVKMGCNRYQAALEQNYTQIDCIFFNHTDDCVKMARWFEQCDPLHNTNCEPYSGKFNYIQL
jgi:hypothetical protein